MCNNVALTVTFLWLAWTSEGISRTTNSPNCCWPGVVLITELDRLSHDAVSLCLLYSVSIPWVARFTRSHVVITWVTSVVTRFCCLPQCRVHLWCWWSTNDQTVFARKVKGPRAELLKEILEILYPKVESFHPEIVTHCTSLELCHRVCHRCVRVCVRVTGELWTSGCWSVWSVQTCIAVRLPWHWQCMSMVWNFS